MQTDSQDLATFGYRQELDRRLGSFSSFAAGFSYISILTGAFQTFSMGFAAGHEALIWSWPMVLIGQFLVALGFAELASLYPLSGGAYQWSKLTGSPFLGWIVGWTYVACLIVTLAAVALALQSTLPQISSRFQVTGPTPMNAVLLGCLLLLVTTWLNSAGVSLLAKVNNLGVFTELVGVIILIAGLCFRAVRPATQVFFPPTVEGRGFVAPLLISAAVTASYVLYGFDTAGSLAEETEDPRRKAPRAILYALGAAGTLGMLVLLFALMSAGDLNAGELSRLDGGLPWLVKRVLGETFGTLLLWDVVFAILVCAVAVHAGAVRLIFAMARDGILPFSEPLSRVSPTTKTPIVPAILTGAVAITILAINMNLPRLIELVTMVAALWANLAYLFVTAGMFLRRIGKRLSTPLRPRGFTLGRWGLPVNLLATVWSAFMVLNLGWPRAEVYGDGWQSRFAPLLLTLALLGAGTCSYFLMQRPQRLSGESEKL